MRHVLLLAATLAAVPARAQGVRVSVPVNVPGASGVTGAVGAVPGVPTGAGVLAPTANLLGPTGMTSSPGPVMLSPFVGRKTTPADGQAGASVTRSVRSEKLTDAAPRVRTAPTAASRNDMVPPEPGTLAPSAVTSASRHAPNFSAYATPDAGAASRAGEGESKGLVGDAARRLRLAAPWIKPGASADEILRVMDSLFGGNFPPGKATARKYASMLLDGFGESRPSGMTTAFAADGEGNTALTPALSRKRERETVGNGTRNLESAPGATAFSADGTPAFTHVDALFGMRVDGSGDAGFAFGSRYSSVGTDETREPAPPKLLRLESLETEAEEAFALGLRVMDSPANTRGVSAQDAALAAGQALERSAEEPTVSSDRVLGSKTPLPPAPSRSWTHGWLPYWTAAAASRLVLARSY